MPRQRTRKFYNPSFDYHVYIRIGGSPADARDYLAKKLKIKSYTVIERDLRDTPDYAQTIMFKGDVSHIMWFKEEPATAIAAHEAYHSICHALECRGIKNDSYSAEETYAYQLEWTMNCLAKFILRDY